MSEPRFIELPVTNARGRVLPSSLFINVSEIKWVKADGNFSKVALKDGSILDVEEHYESVTGMIQDNE